MTGTIAPNSSLKPSMANSAARLNQKRIELPMRELKRSKSPVEAANVEGSPEFLVKRIPNAHLITIKELSRSGINVVED